MENTGRLDELDFRVVNLCGFPCLHICSYNRLSVSWYIFIPLFSFCHIVLSDLSPLLSFYNIFLRYFYIIIRPSWYPSLSAISPTFRLSAHLSLPISAFEPFPRAPRDFQKEKGRRSQSSRPARTCEMTETDRRTEARWMCVCATLASLHKDRPGSCAQGAARKKKEAIQRRTKTEM